MFLRYINVLFVSLVLDCIVFTQREREEMCIFEHYLRCDGAGLQLQQNQKRYTCRDVLYYHRGYICLEEQSDVMYNYRTRYLFN